MLRMLWMGARNWSSFIPALAAALGTSRRSSVTSGVSDSTEKDLVVRPQIM
jgi:hypothetical protein